MPMASCCSFNVSNMQRVRSSCFSFCLMSHMAIRAKPAFGIAVAERLPLSIIVTRVIYNPRSVRRPDPLTSSPSRTKISCRRTRQVNRCSPLPFPATNCSETCLCPRIVLALPWVRLLLAAECLSPRRFYLFRYLFFFGIPFRIFKSVSCLFCFNFFSWRC